MFFHKTFRNEKFKTVFLCVKIFSKQFRNHAVNQVLLKSNFKFIKKYTCLSFCQRSISVGAGGGESCSKLIRTSYTISSYLKTTYGSRIAKQIIQTVLCILCSRTEDKNLVEQPFPTAICSLLTRENGCYTRETVVR